MSGFGRSLVNIRGVVFGVIIVCLFGLPAVARERPSATELLDRYAANQDRIGSSIKYKCEYSSMGSGRVFSRRSEVRCEGNRIRVLFHKEPDRVLEKRDGVWCAGGVCRVDTGSYESYLWEDDWRLGFQALGSKYHPLGLVSIEGVKKPAHGSGYKVFCFDDKLLWGFLGYGGRIDAVVRKAKELSVRDNMGKVGESSCYIIDAVTEHGKYVLWLDPERGYNIVKAQFLQREGDLNWNYEPVSKEAYDNKSMSNVRLEKIDGLWIPVEADYEHKSLEPNGGRGQRKAHIKRTEIKLNPEFGPDAFAVNDIPDWAPVYSLGGSYDIDTSSYYWHKGQVVDYQGRAVEYKVMRPDEPILVGKPLPAWETLGLDIDEGEIEGKRVLVCIGDMNEPPSWNLVEDLADRYEKLKQKGIMTVVVQVPKLPAGTLKEWEKQWRSMPFPFKVNMADEAVVRARKEWGVRYLPWLILTDTEHVVTAEGFSLPLLLGKPLPDLKDYENIDLTKTKGKRLLVCAGNLNGSSWDSMKKLDEMSGELGREGVSVLCLNAQIKARPVDEKKLRSYYKRHNNNVPFAVPVGLTDKPFRQLCDEWGLTWSRSTPYPWLILTNREHVVVADMFSLRQVDKVIKQYADAKPEDNPLMCLQAE